MSTRSTPGRLRSGRQTDGTAATPVRPCPRARHTTTKRNHAPTATVGETHPRGDVRCSNCGGKDHNSRTCNVDMGGHPYSESAEGKERKRLKQNARQRKHQSNKREEKKQEKLKAKIIKSRARAEAPHGSLLLDLRDHMRRQIPRSTDPGLIKKRSNFLKTHSEVRVKLDPKEPSESEWVLKVNPNVGKRGPSQFVDLVRVKKSKIIGKLNIQRIVVLPWKNDLAHVHFSFHRCWIWLIRGADL